MKLSNKMKEERSIEYLKNYLTKNRVKRLSIKKRELIQELIVKQEKECDKEAWLYVNSSLCKLALAVLRGKKELNKLFSSLSNNKGKNWGDFKKWLNSLAVPYTEIIEINGRNEINIHPLLLLHTFLLIVDTAHDKGFGDILNSL